MREVERIGALILAAGRSRRMGDFKPLLPLRGRTLIENSVGSVLAGGAAFATVVTGFRAGDVEAVLAGSFGARVQFIRNEAYATTDMLRSVQIGASVLPECDAFFLLPGDMPVIAQSTFTSLLAMRAENPAPVIFPSIGGKRKHPPLIDARMIPEILAFHGDGGLRMLWQQHEQDIVYVPVCDPGVGIDLDTPDEYHICKQNYEAHKEV